MYQRLLSLSSTLICCALLYFYNPTEARGDDPSSEAKTPTPLRQAQRELDRQIEHHADHPDDLVPLQLLRERLKGATGEPSDKKRLEQLRREWAGINPGKPEEIERAGKFFEDTQQMMQQHPGDADVAVLRASAALSVDALYLAWEAGRVMVLCGVPERGSDSQRAVMQKLRDNGLDIWSWSRAWSQGTRHISRRLFSEAITAAHDIQDAKEKASALHDVAVAQTMAGDVVQATATLAEAKANALTIVDASQRALMLRDIAVAQIKAGDVAEARATLIAATSIITEANLKSFVLRAITEAQCEAGDFVGAKATTLTLAETDWKVTTLRDIAVAQAKAGNVAEAGVTFAEAKVVALTITETEGFTDPKSSALVSVAEAQAQIGDMTGARDTLTEALAAAQAIADASCQSSTLRGIVKVQAKTGDVTAAKTTALAIADADRKSSALLDIAETQAKTGDAAEAKATLAEAKATALTIADAGHKSSMLLDIAVVQAKAGDVTEARTTLADAKAAAMTITETSIFSDPKSSALSDIAVAQAKTGDGAGAKGTLAETLIAAQAIADLDTKSQALRDIAVAQAKTGDMRAAKTTVQAIANPDSKFEALSYIAAVQAEAEDVSGAKATLGDALAAAQTLTNESRIHFALFAILEAQINIGDIAGAKATAQAFVNMEQESWPYGVVAEAQADAGDELGAWNTSRLISLPIEYNSSTYARMIEIELRRGLTPDLYLKARTESDPVRLADLLTNIAAQLAKPVAPPTAN